MTELLGVEDDASLLDFRCDATGVPLWPGVRSTFLRLIMADRVIGEGLVESRRGRSFRLNRSRAVAAILKAAAHNVRIRRSLRGTVLLTTSGVGLVWREGCWFNRLSDHFALSASDETVTMEEMFKWQYRSPRCNDRVLFHTPILLGTYISGLHRVRARHVTQAERLIRLVSSRAKRLLKWDLPLDRERFLVRLLSRHAASIPAARRMYQGVLERTGATLLLKEMGCYGQSSVFNYTARDFGVATAEYQHGVISRGHDAYNIAPSLASDDLYRRTLPSHLLTYGSWWEQQTNVPVRKVTIGNPYRSEHIAGLSPGSGLGGEILVLGDGIRTKFYLDLAEGIAAGLKGKARVVFRPHPLERDRMTEGGLVKNGKEIGIDHRSDIYESFATARAVVSEVSSGLFEAVGLVEQVFVLDTPRSRFSLPDHPFESFTDASDLLEKLQDGTAGRSGIVDPETVWAPGWKRNYLAFLGQNLARGERNQREE